MRTLALFLILAGASALATTCPPDWSYSGGHGPWSWGHQTPQCGYGQVQSPIDLSGDGESEEAGELPPLSFHYGAVPLVVENTSRLLLVPARGGGHLRLGDERYELVQFHFHVPSEHTVQGWAADAELHLVHRGASGDLVVIAVLLTAGEGHEALRRIIERLPVEPCHRSTSGGMLELDSLLPEEGDYVTYSGSLTTPPCSEKVHWMVMTQPLTASAQQLQALAPMGPNNRPIQPLHGRKLLRGEAARH
jgi:carbonic anhydrase